MHYNNIDKVKIFYVLPWHGCTAGKEMFSAWNQKLRANRFGPDIYQTLIRRWICDDADEIKIRLHVPDMETTLQYQQLHLKGKAKSFKLYQTFTEAQKK